MSCCDQNATTAVLTTRHRMRLRYEGGRPLEVTGSVTGSIYRFSGLERDQLVDPRDAMALLRSRVFRMKGIVEVSDRG